MDNNKEILTINISDTPNRSRQLFKEISGRLGKIGRNSYFTALSTIGASKNAGKTAVLKMEINSRKHKMKALFGRLGEIIYAADEGKSANIFKDPSIQNFIDEIKSHANEIKEIEQYINSLGHGGNGNGNGNGNAEEIKSSEIATVIAPSCAEAIKNGDTESRISALKELFKLEGLEAISHLIEALRDNDAEIRRKAALYLGWKMAVSAAHPLIAITNDRNAAVRKASIEALGELGTKEAVPTLIKSLDDQDYEVRKAAYKSLTKITNEFIEFIADGSLSERFKSMQKWEKWWEKEKK